MRELNGSVVDERDGDARTEGLGLGDRRLHIVHLDIEDGPGLSAQRGGVPQTALVAVDRPVSGRRELTEGPVEQ